MSCPAKKIGRKNALPCKRKNKSFFRICLLVYKHKKDLAFLCMLHKTILGTFGASSGSTMEMCTIKEG